MSSVSPVPRIGSDEDFEQGICCDDEMECDMYDEEEEELREEELDACEASHEDELAALRGEKCFLEYRTTELEVQVTEMKQSALQDEDESTTIQRLEAEIVAYKQGVEEARVALEDTLEEKRTAEERLRSTEAVFNERKRNFDHIITIFGEEKKTILEAKAEVEEKLKVTADELERALQAVPQHPPQHDNEDKLQEQEKDLDTLKARVDELETMLGLSGLARQNFEKKNTELAESLAKMKTVAEAAQKDSSDTLQAKSEELKAKVKEIADLKVYVGKKSIQWEQFKEDAIVAKKKLEEKFDERCNELDTLQLTLHSRQEAMDRMRRELDSKHDEIAQLKSANSIASADLMGLLEEKEQQIEELTKRADAPPASGPPNTASIVNIEMTQLINRNKNLEDEVMGLKSLIFKLERRTTRSSATGGSGTVTGAHRTPSPSALTRSLSNQRGMRYPSPASRNFSCPSPTARTGRKPSLSATNRGVSPVGRNSPVPRAYSPCTTARRASVGQSRPSARVARQAGNSPLRKVPSSTYNTPSSSSLYATASPGTRLMGRSKGSSTPLAPRSVNCQIGDV